MSLASLAVKYQLSKFQPCLPDAVEAKLLSRAVDVRGVQWVLDASAADA